MHWSGAVERQPFTGYPDDAGAGQYSDHGYRAQRPQARRFTPTAPSTFGAAKLSKPIPSLQVGDRVSHDGFGMGTVVALRGTAEKAQAEVDFGSLGSKWLVLRFAPLVKL